MSSNLPIKKNFGSDLYTSQPYLARQLDELYTDIANAVNQAPKNYVSSNRDPDTSAQLNALFSIGDFYIRTDTDSAWIMTSRTTDIAVTWTKIT